MSSRPALADSRNSVATGRRAAILGLLRSTPTELSASDVADRAGVHVNTARFHLEALVADGLADRTTEPRESRGRPRVLYSAEGNLPGPRSYELLSEMLTGLVASLEGAGPAALESGRAWGRHLVERPAPSERVGDPEAVDRLNRVLDAVGFEPETGPVVDGQTEIRLHHCPFREVAERHTDVVCAIHLGLMQGALGELRSGVEATSLQPWVTPTLCTATLRHGNTTDDNSARRRPDRRKGSQR